MPPLRVRFAPSPTGYLHIGSVRTALFNYLFAKSQKGYFHLRMEDTDRERSREEYEHEILRGMQWLGLDFEGPLVKQSERFGDYAEAARKLVREGKAFVSTEKGGEAIVFKTPPGRVAFNDLVHGRIEVDTVAFGDQVLVKSDGSPTYNFACVIDDHAMGITQVIRGDDHISNTPKQLVLYEALSFDPPEFGHLPLILGDDGAPLSKRHGAVSLRAYQEEGFLQEALLNYLAVLGWSPEGNREIFSLEELIARFSISRINANAAAFSREKLRWMNGEHIRVLETALFEERLISYMREFVRVPDAYEEDVIRRAAPLFRDRVKTFKEFWEQADYFFKDELSFDCAAVKKCWGDARVKEYLENLAHELEAADFRSPQALESSTRSFAARTGIQAKDVIHPLRLALTGRSVSPGLFELMAAMGRERVLSRVRKAAERFFEIKELAHG